MFDSKKIKELEKEILRLENLLKKQFDIVDEQRAIVRQEEATSSRLRLENIKIMNLRDTQIGVLERKLQKLMRLPFVSCLAALLE
jgi:hypothetical protein